MNIFRVGFKISLAALSVSLGSPAPAQSGTCNFPNGDRTTATEIISNIRSAKGVCAVPWRALKRTAADPANRQTIELAYDDIASQYPERAVGVRARKADVAAAAGQPQDMLAIADANILASPDDKSLSYYACFIRGRYGFDVEHAMPFCNAAVEAGRPALALLGRGRVLLKLGMFQEALADFNEALSERKFKEHPMFVDAAYGRGIARLRLSDTGGKKDLRAAMKVRASVAADFGDAGILP